MCREVSHWIEPCVGSCPHTWCDAKKIGGGGEMLECRQRCRPYPKYFKVIISYFGVDGGNIYERDASLSRNRTEKRLPGLWLCNAC